MLEYIRAYKKTISLLLGILLVLGVFTYAFFAPGGWFSGLQNDLGLAVDTPDARYLTLDGVLVDLADFKGKPLIVNMWATWMPFSKDELALLIEAKNTHGEDISVIAMNRMEDSLTIRAYLGTYGIPESLTFLIDQHDSFYKAIGGYAMPETLFYDAEGVLVFHKRGTFTKEELEQHILDISK